MAASGAYTLLLSLPDSATVEFGAAGERDVRHWHIDYLLGHPASEIVAVVESEGADAECAVCREIDAEAIAGIGASDCDCDSHLRYAPDGEALERAVREAHASACASRGGGREAK